MHQGMLPAERLIKRLADKCSSPLLDRLQTKIKEFKDPQVIKDYKRYLKSEHYRRYFDFRNEHLLSQYVLFSAIPTHLRNTVGLRGVSEGRAKFGVLPTHKARGEGGVVQSSIPSDKLRFVSDKQWLNLVNGDWVKRGGNWRKDRDYLREASHEQFSRTMGSEAERQPTRFADLALKLPAGKGDGYLSRILWGMRQTQPPKDKDGNDLPDWQRPSHSQVFALLRHIGFRKTDDFGRGFCYLFSSYQDINWPSDILENLRRYALEHPDPVEGSYAISSNKTISGESVSIPDYDGCTINAVRPLAAEAIGHVLYEKHELFAEFESTIEALVTDDSPLVRIGAISVCLPILNFDREKAVALFLRACEFADVGHRDGILGSRNTNIFLRHALHSHANQLKQIILAMKNSSCSELQETGSQWIVSEWLRHGGFEGEVTSCVTGSVEQRKGAAFVVANYWNQVPDPVRKNNKSRRYFNWLWNSCGLWDTNSAFDIASRLFDDPEKEVGQIASSIFRDIEIYETRWFPSLARCFLKSNSVSHSLEDLTGGLKERPSDDLASAKLLFLICKRVSQMHRTPDQQMPEHSMAEYDLPELLLRLYHQSTDSKNRILNRKCLDAWDRMLKANFGNCNSQLAKIDASN